MAQDLALEDPHFDAAGPVGGERGGNPEIDVGTQRMQRHPPLAIPLHPGDFSPAKAGTSLNFGAYGLKALEPERLNAREIEAARRAITREMKRAGRVWIRIFPDVPVSKKPAEVRMGSGKGAPEFWVAKVKPGRILFEIDGVDLETAKEAMRLGQAKLSIHTKFIARTV